MSQLLPRRVIEFRTFRRMHNADGRDGMDETRLNAVQYMVVFMLLASGQIGYL